MERYICIHGHFYQPPRENPSLEAVEMQDSAYPYHDWNERITAECYGPNGASRILDGDGRIVKIANNYARMSFNIGPTLLNWMQEHSPEVYHSVLAADRESRERFSGHGSALAQAYNHMILPLANSRDKRSQVIWGIRDFEHRFGRFPEGMWLSETAADLATLDVLAEQGIKFTILAQNQASRIRMLSGGAWRDVSGGRIDPTRAYQVNLPSGRTIAAFFYDGPISRAIAFEGLLTRGEQLADRLINAFSDSRSWSQLVHIATDGESYGHHHRHGDMALAYALHHIESNNLAKLTNYGEYLEKHPPTREVQIFDNSSWSCIHGVERWKSDCGCNSGGYPGWNQRWRAPLREALDWLRDELAARFERRGRRFFRDPWVARDDYVSIVMDRSPENVESYLKRHATRELNEFERIRALKLLEIQRQAMLMYTSCGWFFDELSGIETVQVIQYAGRAIQLAQEVFGESLEGTFRKLLKKAKSNVPEHRDGDHIYGKWVKPSLVDLKQVGAHYAMSSLFEDYGKHTNIYCYAVDSEDYRLLSAGKVRLALGKAIIKSRVTQESKRVGFGVLHLGDHNISGGVREFLDDEVHETVAREVAETFARTDLTELIRVVDKHFGSHSYSLKLLFRDEQRKILRTILDSTLGDSEAMYRQVYEHHSPMMRFLSDLSAPPPKAWHAAAELVVNSGLRRAFESDELDLEAVPGLLEEARRWQLALDSASLGYHLRKALENRMKQLRVDPENLPLLKKMNEALDIVLTLPFEVELWKVQNLYYEMLQAALSTMVAGNRWHNETARQRLDLFLSLGEKLGVRVMEMKETLLKNAPTIETVIEEVAAQRRVPSATYRLQFNRAFTFQNARDLIPYLYDLGISDCYSSPLLKARTDSSHGYDICDHSQINPHLGGEEDFQSFTTELRNRGMGLLMDMVPNHMGIGEACNLWWMDVLENGPSSLHANYFDIDWHPVKPELQNKVLLPILGEQYGKVLEKGEFRLTFEDGAFFLYYYDIKLPIAPRTYSSILSYQLDTLAQALGDESEQMQELRSIMTAINYLPPRTELAAEKIEERNREKEVIKRRISGLYQASAYVRAAIDTAVQAFNGTVGNPRSFDGLDTLLDDQAYRPAYWRVAAEEINYRRFFDINELAAIRMELPEVFHATHQVILRWIAEGKITGLRIDHPDGLWNPRDYLSQLQRSNVLQQVKTRLSDKIPEDDLREAVSTWFTNRFGQDGTATPSWPLYVVAEKILCGGETLPTDWPVDGTTGYDFLNTLNGIFVNSAHRGAFDRIYHQFTRSDVNFRNLTNSCKKMIMLVSLASEINALAHQLERLAAKNRLYRDFTLNSLTFALREVIAALPVYRTYISEDGSVSQQDETYIETATEEAKRRNPRTAASIFDFLRDTLLLRNLWDFREEDRRPLIEFVMEFQQVTGPVMAKSVEDTAFYVYNRLVSLNEVGGHPEQFGCSVADFHRQNSDRRQQWPSSLLATSTHDTKRSEDVRARINVLSEIPEEWRVALGRWSRLNESKKVLIGNEPAPDRNDEYLLYQTLLGTWPESGAGGRSQLFAEEFASYRDRIAAYMSKATKEAKVHTSWVNPNEQYDAAVRGFVGQLLAGGKEDPFLKEFLPFQRRVAYYGRYNALSQLLLKLTAPGVPDIYQGAELWDFSLVDPDNRKPVDYRQRKSLLAELKERLEREGADLTNLISELLENPQDGRIKLFVTHRTLGFRRAHDRLFSDGCYLPVMARGTKREHICGFIRALDNEAVLVVVPRLVVGLTGGKESPPLGSEIWEDSWLSLPREQKGKGYRDLFTGELVRIGERHGSYGLPLAELLNKFPVALLELLP